MKPIPVALAWATLLIGLPLLRHTGMIMLDTITGMQPVLIVLAAIHISALQSERGCSARDAF